MSDHFPDTDIRRPSLNRAYAENVGRLFQQGDCLHPVRLAGQAFADPERTRAILEVSAQRLLYARCGQRRAFGPRGCPSCARRYAADAWHVVMDGFGPHRRADGEGFLFVTLTAPSMRTEDAPGSTLPHHQLGDCKCSHHHAEGDPAIGAPLRPQHFDYARAVRFNMSVAALWEDTCRHIRAERKRQGLSPAFAYLRVNEHHRSGVLHVHAVIRGSLDLASLREAIGRAETDGFKWSSHPKHGVRIDLIGGKDEAKAEKTAGQIASYVAKYLTKGFVLETLSSKTPGALHSHLRRMRSAASKLAAAEAPFCAAGDMLNHLGAAYACRCSQCQQARRKRRRMVENLGFSGHVFSKSSGHGVRWGKTLADCRRERHAFRRRSVRESQKSTWYEWLYEGQGYLGDEWDTPHLKHARSLIALAPP